MVLSQGNTCSPPQVPGVWEKVFLKRTPDDQLSWGGPSLALPYCPFLPYGSPTPSGSSAEQTFAAGETPSSVARPRPRGSAGGEGRFAKSEAKRS